MTLRLVVNSFKRADPIRLRLLHVALTPSNVQLTTTVRIFAQSCNHLLGCRGGPHLPRTCPLKPFGVYMAVRVRSRPFVSFIVNVRRAFSP